MSLKNEKEFSELRPYEKLEMYGENSLKTVELLAIIIKTGTKDKNAIEVANEMKTHHKKRAICVILLQEQGNLFVEG